MKIVILPKILTGVKYICVFACNITIGGILGPYWMPYWLEYKPVLLEFALTNAIPLSACAVIGIGCFTYYVYHKINTAVEPEPNYTHQIRIGNVRVRY